MCLTIITTSTNVHLVIVIIDHIPNIHTHPVSTNFISIINEATTTVLVVVAVAAAAAITCIGKSGSSFR